MHTRNINPWLWQNDLGYSQAVEVKNNQATLYCSGQAAMTVNGQPEAGDMDSQIENCFRNLSAVIEEAGYEAKNIVRINFYTTSIPAFFGAYQRVTEWMSRKGCQPSSTLLEVQALAFPGLSLEVEATVVR